jgi:iron complex outermembrane recepter protein
MRLGRNAGHALLLASTAVTAPAWAQAPVEEESAVIIVTAQKREEDLQKVPISIQALGGRKLEQLNISNFQDFTKQLPSVSFLSAQPGVTTVYMRGVAAVAGGAEGNHSGSLPQVGTYLDEQPVTTIGGTLDVHIYDISRIESLAGPQGTLYGASSEAGTIRIITNKPDLGSAYGQIDGAITAVANGGGGGKLEGFYNLPLTSNMALRVVGFYQRDPGFIDNVFGCRAFLPETDPAACTASNGGIAISNTEFVQNNYNDTEIAGGRAALKVELDGNWTVTPTVMYQDTRSHGFYAYDPSVGDLKVQHSLPEFRRDRFVQAALTVEGKIGNWDLVYAGAYLDRTTYSESDYTDYAEAYDALYADYGGLAGYFYFLDNGDNLIDPRQHVIGSDHFRKMSQELRISSPSDAPLRLVAGLFFQRQSNAIHQDYQVAGLAPLLSVNGLPGTLWLTQQHRVDKDYAVFGEASYDIDPTLTFTAGLRAFKYDNTLIGFFGFGRNPGYVQGASGNPPPNGAGSSRTGVAGCFTTTGARLRDAQLAGQTNNTLLPAAVSGSPCTNLGTFANGAIEPVQAEGDGVTYRFNLSWKATPDTMFYATWSRGFRPGGINRRADVAPYQPDYLTNYEVGAKIALMDGKMRINSALYQQDWKQFQFSFLGANSFTEIHNGPNARIRGFETDIAYVSGPLSLSSAFAFTDAKTRQNLCLFTDPTLKCTDPGNLVSAPAGTRLPITPQFKISGTGRYSVPIGAAKGFGQISLSHQSSASSDLRQAVFEVFSGNVISPAAKTGRISAFNTVDIAAGADWSRYSVEFFVSNLFDERGELSRFSACGSCGQRPYILPITPRTVGLRLGGKF